MDIVLFLLIAVVGYFLKRKSDGPRKPPPNRRQQRAERAEARRTSAPGPAMPGPVAQQGQGQGAEEIFRQLFGLGEEEKEGPDPEELAAQEERRKIEAERREAARLAAEEAEARQALARAEARRRQVARDAEETKQRRIAALEVEEKRHAPKRAGKAPTPARAASVAVAAEAEFDSPSAWANRLRSNPQAAREAFIYSEIFGPPLSDRQD